MAPRKWDRREVCAVQRDYVHIRQHVFSGSHLIEPEEALVQVVSGFEMVDRAPEP